MVEDLLDPLFPFLLSGKITRTSSRKRNLSLGELIH